MSQITLTLPDGSEKSVEAGSAQTCKDLSLEEAVGK